MRTPSRAALMLVLGAAICAAQQCSVAGSVVDPATGVPIPGVTVVLRDQKHAYSGRTDREGRFAANGFEPGSYRFTASKAGYVRAALPAPLKFDPGQHRDEVDFRLPRAAVIAGVVTDPGGDPVMGEAVTLMKPIVVEGRRDFREAGSGLTNDLGEYRIGGLAAGRYYVVAGGQPHMPVANFSVITENGTVRERPDRGYARTWYPGAHEAGKAAAVELRHGVASEGVDLRLEKSPRLRVTGRVQPLQALTRGASVLLFEHDASSPDRYAGYVDPKGGFEISGVRPGSYDLQVIAGREENGFAARRRIELRDVDQLNISVSLVPYVQVRGQLHYDGPEGLNPGRGAVYLAGLNVSAGGAVGADGKFAMWAPPIDGLRVSVAGLNPGFYVKSARLGKEEVNGKDVDISHGGVLDVAIRGNAGSVSGRVLSDGKPLGAATVALIPKQGLAPGKTAQTDGQGRFTIADVEPGSYKAYAWADVEPLAWLDPDFIRLFESKGIDVEMLEGSRPAIQLQALR